MKKKVGSNKILGGGGANAKSPKSADGFIALAVSAHDDLLAALKSAQEHLEYCGYGDKWERECAKASGLEDRITAAIAKAEGRT